MPISPSLRKYYGSEWRAYRRELIQTHGPKCSVCGREIERYLNLAHLTHDPKSSAVALLCAADHNRHDAGHRLAVMRRNRAKRVGQLWLLDEIEWACYPPWLIPKRVLTEGQMDFGFACGAHRPVGLPQRSPILGDEPS